MTRFVNKTKQDAYSHAVYHHTAYIEVAYSISGCYHFAHIVRAQEAKSSGAVFHNNEYIVWAQSLLCNVR